MSHEHELVLVVDFGAQYAQLIARRVREARIYSEIVPHTVSVTEIMARKPKAIVLSGGPQSVYAPGAPQVDSALFATGIPTFGICLGHQLLALASGARTLKMKFGHHGANHPVKDLDSGQVLITSQNHGFAADAATLPANVRVTHVSLFEGDANAFYDASAEYNLSKIGRQFIAGLLRHAAEISAVTNQFVNSYKRLVPGFEAPVLLAYSSRNRSASIRIPFGAGPKAKRIEVRFPDPMANSYLAFAAMLMAGLDGVQNKIHPGDPADNDLRSCADQGRRGRRRQHGRHADQPGRPVRPPGF